jgi:predicted acylesterase/phospholipase RssA
LKIANDAIVARAGLPPETCSRIHEALLTIGEGKPGLPPELFKSELGLVGFRDVDLTHYHTVEHILSTGLMRGDRYSVSQAIDSIRWDVELETEVARLEKRVYKPKIALVFSGGGAAGAFQAGAAMEVVGALKEAKMNLDIVVGTSVGAINGTAVAMGRSDILSEFWATVTMDKILAVREEDKPIGLWKIILLRIAQRAPATLMAVLFCLLAYFEVLLFAWALRPLRLKFWGGTLIVLAVGGTAVAIEGRITNPCMVTVGALFVAHVLVLRARNNPPPARWRVWLRRMHAVALIVGLVLVPAQIHRAFGEREALFANDNIYNLLSTFFLRLRGRPLKNPEEMRTEVAAASRDMVFTGLPHTLVISTTDFQRQTGRTFYVTQDREIERRARDHGYTSIPDECPDGLIDLVVASAAVFPVLEPVNVSLKSGEKLRLIDGGFVHNNPVQVAVDLGATHVLILKPAVDQDFIESDPSLMSSLFSFFGWLIARSQTEDLRAKDEVMSFLIGPTHEAGVPMIGPLEFDGHYRGPWGTERAPALTLSQYLEAGRAAARSSDRGFQLWSRGAFKLPPIQ